MYLEFFLYLVVNLKEFQLLSTQLILVDQRKYLALGCISVSLKKFISDKEL